ARAGVTAAKVDWLPNVAIVGGYANQSFADYIQPNIGYVGVQGSYTFLDWGKRRNTIRRAENLVARANLKVPTTQDEVPKEALEAFGDCPEDEAAVKGAEVLPAGGAAAPGGARRPDARRLPGPGLEPRAHLVGAGLQVVEAVLAAGGGHGRGLARVQDA